MTPLQYTGKALERKTVTIPADGSHGAEVIFPYLPEPGLIRATNLAILLKRPLLLMGEPGGGKTRLAQALAYELHHRDGQHYRDLFFEWHVKSTSKAREGLYVFDAIRRLRDAQVSDSDIDIRNYIDYGPMGKAFLASTSEESRPVLLIDEIDKADIDFPNDLLNELDNGSFMVEETGEFVVCPVKPIVVITSNQERELPDAFLRRCIFHYIKPLDEPDLRKIVLSRFYSEETPDNDLIDHALRLFLRIRDEISENRTAGKNVSTSELLDWFEAMKAYLQAIDTGQAAGLLSADEIKALENFRKGRGGIPLQQALFKNWETIIDFEKRAHEFINEENR